VSTTLGWFDGEIETDTSLVGMHRSVVRNSLDEMEAALDLGDEPELAVSTVGEV
jgi:hypothetical protein